MPDWFRIAKSDILLLMTDFQNKCNTTEIYDECDTKSWKELYEANAWEIKIEKMSIEEYIDIFTYSDGADIASASFDRCVCFNSGDRCFGSYLQDNYYKLVEMSQSFDEKVFTKDVSFATVKIDACGVPNAISYATKDYVDTVANNIEFNEDVVINGSLTVKEKGDTNMNKLGLDFGSCKNDNIKLSPYGIAVKNLKIGTWVSYDPKGKKTIDVNDFVMDGTYLYKLPVAIKDVKTGDVILHNKVPVYVEKVEDGKLLVIDPVESEERIVLPITNMFGFNFVTKVVSIMDMSGVAPTADSPFGNMLPFMMASSGNIDPVMLMLMSGKAADFTSNPMMLYFLLDNKGNKNDNLLPLMMMLGLPSTDKK